MQSVLSAARARGAVSVIQECQPRLLAAPGVHRKASVDSQGVTCLPAPTRELSLG